MSEKIVTYNNLKEFKAKYDQQMSSTSETKIVPLFNNVNSNFVIYNKYSTSIVMEEAEQDWTSYPTTVYFTLPADAAPKERQLVLDFYINDAKSMATIVIHPDGSGYIESYIKVSKGSMIHSTVTFAH